MFKTIIGKYRKVYNNFGKNNNKGEKYKNESDIMLSRNVAAVVYSRGNIKTTQFHLLDKEEV